MKKKLFLPVIVFALTMMGAHAVITIEMGSHNLLPDTPGQTIDIFYNNDSGTVPVAGLDVVFGIADGVAATGPTFEGIDFEPSGGLFEGNYASSPVTLFSGDQGLFTSATTPGLGTVDLLNGSHLLLTLSIDTSGFFSGSFNLVDLGGTGFTDAGANSVATTVIPGTLTVVPEPHEYALIASLGLLGWAVVRKRRTGPARA